ncbi:glycosyltransferase family 9 protein [Nitratidesulfovibrio sp. HK-II]|uniref:glycosyltransferase family 9 protein n=1 Tax=Nitratidesulfovibrio sp. HK-II TaxID=2009266 RepID=UPI000E2E6CAB|nr:glycosyltransferase family 9 protein [Nitratidesulfovibrio sp. HK-II]GBO97874.1 heptosyltransferase family protein [Nitratidesulfovibrio sp. HK-II]
MNLLLVNLTRFGDLLQTQPVVHGLRAQGHRVGLVCLENFAGAAALLEGVDHVAALPGSALLAGVQPGGDWRVCTAGLMTWANRLRSAYAHDAVLNLTATLGGRLLARLLAGNGEGGGDGGDLRGFGLDPFGFGVNADPWSAFLQASTRQRGCSPFNLVDLFRMAAGVGGVDPVYALRGPLPDALAEAGARLAQAAPPDHAGYVAMQLGASEERRRWPVAHFAALAARLWRELRLVPVLLGAGGERTLGERLRAALAEDAATTGADQVPCIDLIGATSLPQLAATLRHMRLLVTNDTGTMHLAAGLDVPVLAIFLATAQPWDTGPYREDCCCLEPALDCHPCPFGAPCPHAERCRHVISADIVFDLARHHLSTGGWPTAAEPAGAPDAPDSLDGPDLANAPREARVWRTLRETDPTAISNASLPMPGRGFMDLVSLSGHEGDDRTRWIRLQRHFYRQFLDRAVPCPSGSHPATPHPAGQTGEPRPGHSLWPPQGPCALTDAVRARAVDELRQADALLHLMGEQGGLLKVRPSDMAKSRFLGTVGRVQALWDNSGLFNVLGHLWLCESQGAGGTLDSVLALAAAYRGLVRAWLAHLEASA